MASNILPCTTVYRCSALNAGIANLPNVTYFFYLKLKTMKLKSLLFALLMVMSVGVKASGNLSNMQAMYIVNFLRLIQWPDASTSNTFVIGVYGNSQTFDQLVEITKTRKVGTKSIEIKKINSTKEAENCQVVFVPVSNSSQIAELQSNLGNRPCLLISEKEGMNNNGSTIEFVIQNDKLRFRINETRAKQQNLMVSKTLIDLSV